LITSSGTWLITSFGWPKSETTLSEKASEMQYYIYLPPYMSTSSTSSSSCIWHLFASLWSQGKRRAAIRVSAWISSDKDQASKHHVLQHLLTCFLGREE
jgi:hypothetical protein